MTPLYRQGITIAVLLLVLIGLGFGTGQLAQNSPQASTATTQPQVQPITYQGEEGKTVLELLQRDHQVETTESSIGTYVTSIDGVEQSQNSFWIFYIDGQLGDKAVDDTTTKDGQSIEWRYETF